MPTRSKSNAQTKDVDEACIFLTASNLSTSEELEIIAKELPVEDDEMNEFMEPYLSGHSIK